LRRVLECCYGPSIEVRSPLSQRGEAYTRMYSLDFWLAVAVLAAVPLWMAAYGGHVAAESISDKRRRLSVRLRFWGIGFLGLAVAFAYQYRTAKSDESRQDATKEWQNSVTKQLTAIQDNPAYSKEQKQVAGGLQRQVDQGPRPLSTVRLSAQGRVLLGQITKMAEQYDQDVHKGPANYRSQTEPADAWKLRRSDCYDHLQF
jgi:hypothetical protein